MAEDFIRHQVWDNGVLVSETTTAKPSEMYVHELILEQAGDAINANTTFMEIASPTNAQVLAQVRALTRQNTKIIRLLLQRFDAAE